MTYKGLPVFDLNITEDCFFENVSLVDEPAIERDFIKFSKEPQYQFSVDKDKHIVTGPVLIPDQMIYRKKGDKAFYTRFSKEAIEEMALRFFKDHRNTDGNVMHQITVDGVTYFESYILNHDRNIAPVEFADLPDGTWMMTAKIENEELWKLVKEGVIKGFSISSECVSTPAKDEIDDLEELMEYLNNI